MNTEIDALLSSVIGKKAAKLLLIKLQEIGEPSYMLRISSEEELATHIGKTLAKRLGAALKLSRSLAAYSVLSRVSSPECAYNILRPGFRPRQECIQSIYLDSQNQVLSVKLLSIGSSDEGIIDYKEFFRWAVLLNASKVLISHNHPSNNLTPSPEDIALTRCLKRNCDMMFIELLDHLILGEDSFVSIKKNHSYLWQE